MTSQSAERSSRPSSAAKESLKSNLNVVTKNPTNEGEPFLTRNSNTTNFKADPISSENGSSFSVSALCSNESSNSCAQPVTSSELEPNPVYPFSSQERADMRFKEILLKCINNGWKSHDDETSKSSNDLSKEDSPYFNKRDTKSATNTPVVSPNEQLKSLSLDGVPHKPPGGLKKPKPLCKRQRQEQADSTAIASKSDPPTRVCINLPNRKRRRRHSHDVSSKHEIDSSDCIKESSSSVMGSTSGRLRITIKKLSSADTETYRIESTTVQKEGLHDGSAIPPTSHSSTTATSVPEDMPDSEEDHGSNVAQTSQREQKSSPVVVTSQAFGPLPKIRIKMPQLSLQPPTSAPSVSKRVCQSNSPITRCQLADGRVFEIGNIVWAKIQGYPFWPSRIVRIEKRDVPGVRKASTSKRKPLTKALFRSTKLCDGDSPQELVCEYHCCVDWLAWNQHSYIPCDKLYHFQECYDQKFAPKNKSKQYAQAVKEALEILADNPPVSHVSSNPIPPSRLAEFLPLKIRIPYNIIPVEPFPHVTGVSGPIATSSGANAAPRPCQPPPCSQSTMHLSENSTTAGEVIPTSFWQISSNSDDLPVLSGQLFGETNHTGATVPEFSDDEEITLRKNITGTVINL